MFEWHQREPRADGQQGQPPCINPQSQRPRLPGLVDAGADLQLQCLLLRTQPRNDPDRTPRAEPVDLVMPAMAIDVDQTHQVSERDHADVAQADHDRPREPGVERVAGDRLRGQHGLQVVKCFDPGTRRITKRLAGFVRIDGVEVVEVVDPVRGTVFGECVALRPSVRVHALGTHPLIQARQRDGSRVGCVGTQRLKVACELVT